MSLYQAICDHNLDLFKLLIENHVDANYIICLRAAIFHNQIKIIKLSFFQKLVLMLMNNIMEKYLYMWLFIAIILKS